MTKFYTLFLAIAFLPSFINAQCTINASQQTTPGVYPAAINLPCIERTLFYDQTLQGKIQASSDTTILGMPVHFDVDSIRLDSIAGLPAGINWGKSPDVLPGGGNGCVRLFGYTAAAVGRYNLEGFGVVWLHMVAPGMGIDTHQMITGSLNRYSPFGGYYVDVINPGSGCRIYFTANLGADTASCNGDTIPLSVATTNGQLPYTYQWSSERDSLSCNDCPNPSVFLTTGSRISVTVTDANNNVASDTMDIIGIGSPVQIVPSGPTTFCQGDSVILTATSASFFAQYQWSDGATTEADTVKQSGTYSVTMSLFGMCPFSDTIVVTVNPRTISNYQITANGPTSFCGGGSVTLDAGTGFASYLWSPGGQQTQTITVSQTNNYSVTVSGNDQCVYTDAQSVNNNTTFGGQQVCAVSVDQTSGKNLVVWEKTVGFAVDSFRVYKETSVSGVYQLIGVQGFGIFSTFQDAQSNPAQQSDRYVVTTVDACGESAYSTSHKTIHLTSNIGINNVVNLAWNAYEGFTYPSFNIYRGSSSSNMVQLTQVNSGTFSYSDLNPPSPPVFYQIEVINPQGCVPTAKTESYSSSRSNVIQINTLGIGTNDKDDFKVISVFDDNTGKNILRFISTAQTNMNLKMFDYSGREVYRNDNINQSEVALPDFISRGIYVAEVAREQRNYRVKIWVR